MEASGAELWVITRGNGQARKSSLRRFNRGGLEGCRGVGKDVVYPGEGGKMATGYAEDRAVARGDDVVGICLFCCSECKTLEACRLGGRDLGGFSLR